MPDPTTELVGFIAGALTTFAFVPQVVRLYRIKHSRDISLPTFSIFCGGVACWLVYGVLSGSTPIILWNAITLALAVTVVALTIRYRGPGRTGLPPRANRGCMLRRLWRILRSVLRSPLTPVLLAMMLYIDVNAIASQLLLTGSSTIADQVVVDLPPMKQRPDEFIPKIEYAAVYFQDDGSMALYTTRPDRPNAEPWPSDKPHIAQLQYQEGFTYSGLYAPTTRRRVSQVTSICLPSASPSQWRQASDLYVDHIIDNPATYPTQLQSRSVLSQLKSPNAISYSMPRYEERSVYDSETLWLGVLHNTLAAAALLALLISTPWSLCTIPGRVRRWRWRRAGYCLNCGYDAASVPGTPFCPECGRAMIGAEIGGSA